MKYKQVSVTKETADKIDTLKREFAKKGEPIQSPAIIGKAINDFAKSLK